jgi:type II secretory pathway component PulC
MLRKILMTALFVNLVGVVACGSDDAAQKKDEPVTAEKAEEPVKEEPVEEKVDLSAFDTAGTLQEATSKGGKTGMSISNVSGAFGDCGLKDGDVIVAINGAAVPAGRAGATALKKACVAGETVTVERDGAEVSAK